MLGLFVLAVLIKNVLFQLFVFGDLYFNDPRNAFKFYGASVAVAIIVGSAIFVAKNRWWTIVPLVIMDIWYMALMIYYRAWGIFMNVSVIQMADNMDGFWQSVWTYMNWKVCVPLVVTLVYAIILVFVPKGRSRRWWVFALLLCIAYCYVPLRQYPIWHLSTEEIQMKNPYTNKLMYTIYNYNSLFKPYNAVRAKAYVSYVAGGAYVWEEKFIREQGFCDYGIAMLVFQATYDYYVFKNDDSKVIKELTNEEQQIVRELVREDEGCFVPQHSMILLLVESLESWAVDYQDSGRYVMPNLHKFMQNNPTFYADKLISQAAFGGSGDGQMLVMTGMIPLLRGAACRLYGDNIYPNIASFYPNSLTLNSSPGAWNQSVVNPSYGIKELDESIQQDDKSIIDSLLCRLKQETGPTFYLVLTVSSHTPFEKAEDVEWEVDKAMPGNMARYVKCIHYFDEQLGRLFSELEKMQKKNDIDIVITGDHIIFQKMMLTELIDYAQDKGVNFVNGENYCPLIVYSPNIQENIRHTDVAYQMDAFPTIKYIVGAEKYWWKGFGINMMSDTVRPYDLNTLKILSDKMIRSNYFAEGKPNQKE